ncbi:hypothetical protein [Pedobacter metabolipauper]|uniref:Outer membrane protein with beta-barrel domain n=1 Tax=Pedobacter metabolipauper TaxID=425513 RepID=A0A4R6T191_9SPHI|nr:hypothetical protein [Pedobacter metabolipauper]TDQ11378.1 hypothetical protein ATK78_0496 [Pedobacter metabolipauper]
MKKYRFVILLCLSLMVLKSYSQNALHYVFNEKGQLLSAPPSILTDHKKTRIYFTVTVSPEYRAQRTIAWYNHFKNQIGLLKKLTDVKASVGLPDTDGKLNDKINAVKYTMAQQLIKLLKSDQVAIDILSKQLNIANEITELAKIDSPKTSIWLPQLEDLMVPAYDLVTDPEFPVQFGRIGGKNEWKFMATLDPVKVEELSICKFKLVQSNEKYLAVIKQLANNKILSASFKDTIPDLKSTNQYIATGLNLVFLDPDFPKRKMILDIFNKQRSGTALSIAESSFITNVSSNEFKYLNGELNKLMNSPELQFFRDDNHINFLLQFSWLINPLSLSANPFKDTIEKDDLEKINGDIKRLDAELKKNKEDLANINQELLILENRSRVSGSSVQELQLLKNTYASRLIDKTNTQIAIEKIQADIKELKDTPDQLKASNIIKDNFLVKDSLLYDGLLYINHKTARPNRNGYAIIRQHDRLNDYLLMGNDNKVQINETQRMYVMVHNSSKDASYRLNTTITSIAADQDLGGLDKLAKQGNLASGSPNKSDDANAAYRFYLVLMNITKPYASGILRLPISPIHDTSPNYVSKLINHELPGEAPAMVNYQIIDSATSKNLSPENITYHYRFNKLYRFRIKTGMTYSFMERNMYTIDASDNSATYTTDRGGLGATVGVQVFTKRLDIQSEKILPHGILPFFYLGYQITDAPANNFLLGGGWEIYSGFAVTGGVHFGKTERLTLNGGALATTHYYKRGAFIGLSIGLQAFDAIFNKAKPTNLFTKP